MKKILIINSAPFTQEFVEPIVKLFNGISIAYDLVDYQNIPNNNQYKGIIISASPMGDDIIKEQLPYYQWLKTTKIPVIGSCHGHQLMGTLFGSSIIINKEAEEGLCPINRIKDDPLFNSMTASFDAEQHHKKSITLPQGFELLASSPKCKNQAMKHQTKKLYGLQFHIESNPTLLQNFVSLC